MSSIYGLRRRETRLLVSDRPSQPPQGSRSPIAEAMQWVSRITTAALMTVLPIWGGGWLDGRLATSYWSLIGLVFGLALGFWQLVLLVKSAGTSGSAAWRPGATNRNDSASSNSGKWSSGKSSTSVSASTEGIAKEIDAVLDREKKSSDRKP